MKFFCFMYLLLLYLPHIIMCSSQSKTHPTKNQFFKMLIAQLNQIPADTQNSALLEERIALLKKKQLFLKSNSLKEELLTAEKRLADLKSKEQQTQQLVDSFVTIEHSDCVLIPDPSSKSSN